MCRLSWNLVVSTSWNPQGLFRPVIGLLHLYRLRSFTIYNFSSFLFLQFLCPKIFFRSFCNYIYKISLVILFSAYSIYLQPPSILEAVLHSQPEGATCLDDGDPLIVVTVGLQAKILRSSFISPMQFSYIYLPISVNFIALVVFFKGTDYEGARGGAVGWGYKPEDRGFDSQWCHWNFSLT